MKNFRQCQIEQTWVEGCNTKLRGFKLRSFEVGSPGKLKLCFKYVIKSNPQYVAAWSKKSESPKLISPGFRITSTLKKPINGEVWTSSSGKNIRDCCFQPSSPNSSILSDRTRMNFIGPGRFVMSAISSHMSLTVSLKGLKRRKIALWRVSSGKQMLVTPAKVVITQYAFP